MANRVTSDEVKEIITTTISDIGAFITAANLIVTDKLTGEGHSDAMLKEIERWLSAHFVAIREKDIKSEEIGEAREEYNLGNLGKGLEFTKYGQQVKLLDTTGILSNLGGRPTKLEAIL